MNGQKELYMPALSTLLAQPRLSLITRTGDREISRIQDLLEQKLLVSDRDDLEKILGTLLASGQPEVPKTLDLIGHSTADEPLLQLGDLLIDGESALTRSLFRELADQDVLPRLGVSAVRLIGSRTATSPRGRRTMRALSELLGLPVYGSTGLVYAASFDADGFCDDLTLIANEDEWREHRDTIPPARATSRVFDIDSLTSVDLATIQPRAERHVVDVHVSRVIVEMLERSGGAWMPGLLALPSCELALPATEPGRHYVAHLMIDDGYLRVYPTDLQDTGMLYRVSAPHELRELIDQLR